MLPADKVGLQERLQDNMREWRALYVHGQQRLQRGAKQLAKQLADGNCWCSVISLADPEKATQHARCSNYAANVCL
jgi:hypothetical protein